jgi:tRNA-intron endonuclease
MGVGILSGTKVIVGDADTKTQLKERDFGEVEGRHLIISLIEAIFLTETGKFDVMDGNKKAGFEELLKMGSKVEKEFYNRYLVYKDLRERGLIVRTGLKFGSDFRVYQRGQEVGKGHSQYLVHVVPEEYACSFPEMARSIRLAENVNKQMIYAIVDEEGDVSYYLVDRIKL